MSKKYKITLHNDVVKAIKTRGYDPLGYINLLLQDITNQTLNDKSKDILDKQHKSELNTYKTEVRDATAVEEV